MAASEDGKMVELRAESRKGSLTFLQCLGESWVINQESYVSFHFVGIEQLRTSGTPEPRRLSEHASAVTIPGSRTITFIRRHCVSKGALIRTSDELAECGAEEPNRLVIHFF